MPIYEYICTSCSHEFEELSRSMSNGGARNCPACGKRTAERKLSVFSAREGLSTSVCPPADGGGCGGCRMDSQCPLG